MPSPLISIIIPLFNREDLVRDTLDSLLVQTSSEWEAIVVDDGSTDKSREKVLEYIAHNPQIKLFCRPDNRRKGPSACRNFGFEHAAGEIVFYLDSDDLLEPHFCENAVRQFRNGPSLDFIGVQCVTFPGKVDAIPQKLVPPLPHSNEIRDHFLKKSLQIQTETFCWRKSFLDRYPRHWPEDQRVGEDRVCYYRMITAPCRGAWEEGQIQVFHRTGSASHGRYDQLTPRINRDPVLAAERVLTAERITEAFRRNGNLNPESVDLLLKNGLSCLRGVLSYNHRQAAQRIFQMTTALAEEFGRKEILRRARFYMLLRNVFRFHRIPAVEKTYAFFRRILMEK